MMQAAHFCLVNSQERSAEPFKKDTVKAEPSSKIQSAETTQESTGFKASQGKAPLVTTCGVRTQSGQRMDKAHASNCIQLHFVCFGDYFF